VLGKIGLGLLVAAGGVAALAGVAWLALVRPDIPYETLEAKYARPTSKFADLPGGVRMHYRDDGDPAAPVIMLVHGYGDSFLTWEPMIERLAPDFRVITIDLAGHGLTRAPADYTPDMDRFAEQVDALAGQLGLPPFVIVGNSMGGGVAWQTAVRFPERLSGLVLLDAAGWPADASKPTPLAFKVIGSPAGRYLVQRIETRPLTAQGLRMNVVDKSLITPEFVDRWVEVQRAPGHRAILMGIRPGKHTQATPEILAKIATPTLVLHGEQDVVIEPEAGRKFAAAIPGARLVTYADAGHLPQYEIPDRVAADVAAFARTLTAPSPDQP
jgi:pimeloyl-ACP methyl ester carboxylesterase